MDSYETDYNHELFMFTPVDSVFLRQVDLLLLENVIDFINPLIYMRIVTCNA